MKKGISLILCLIMIFSVFCVNTVASSVADANNLVEVTKTGFNNGIIKFDIYLKKNVSVSGAVFHIKYDESLLEPVQDNNGNAYMIKDSYGDPAYSISGNYASGVSADVNGGYNAGFVTLSSYTATAKRGFFTFSFKLKTTEYKNIDVKFYCVEFNSEKPSCNIPKNEADPQNFYTYSGSTMTPTRVTSVSCTENGLKITWNQIPGAAGYKVYKHLDGEKVLIGNTTELSFNDTTAAAFKTSTYSVSAYDSTGLINSDSANTMSGTFVPNTSDVTLLTQPTGIKIDWKLVDGAGGYRILKYVMTPVSDNYPVTEIYTASATTTTYTDTDVSFGKKYGYIVQAFTSNGAISSGKSATTLFYPSPTVTVTAVTGGVILKWNSLDNVDSYKIYRRYNGATEWTLLATADGSTSTYLDSTATSGRNIDYAVQACCDNIETELVANRIAYVGVPHLTSVANSVNSITVKWNAVQNATCYRIYRRAAGQTYWTYLGTVKTNSYVDKSVKNGVYYKYTVRTVFYSLFSNFEDGILVKCVATPKLTSIANTSSGIKITWNMVSGATGYRVYRRGAGQSTWTYLGTVTGNTYTDAKVVKNNYYRYTVRAVSGYYSGFDTNGLYIKRT